MFERLTDRARRVMALSNQEAQRFNHEYIGTEHILLGLIKEGSGIGAHVLKEHDIDLRKVRLEVERLVKSGPDMVTMGGRSHTPRAMKVIEYAIEEARSLNHNYIGTEHLLLGQLRSYDCLSAYVLTCLGLDLDSTRQSILRLLDGDDYHESRENDNVLVSTEANRVDLNISNIIEWSIARATTASDGLLNLSEYYLTSTNLIKCLPRLAEITGLHTLNLSRNMIGPEGAKAVSTLTNLTSLDFSNNKIGSEGAKAVSTLTNLSSLDFSNNLIGPEGAKAVSTLTKLDTLEFGGNKIGNEGAKAVSTLTNLTYLNLSDTSIDSVGVKALVALTKLETLKINNNGLGDEGITALASLTFLTTLDLALNLISDNGVRTLMSLKNLTSLNLTHNKILGIPPELVSSGDAKAIFAAFSDGVPLNEAKILVVGEPEVGKTRLVGWLVKGQDPGDLGWTRGVQIARWQIPAIDSEEDGEDDGDHIRINVWDFGGQEIMQATHQFFMTERSLYLLVLDARHNEEQSRIRHWLEKIRVFGGDSPVIVVLNKQDVGTQQPDEARLRKDYGSIIPDQFYPTSCETGDGISELSQAVEARLRGLEYVCSLVPMTYLIAKNALEAEADKYKHLSRDKYKAICTQSGVVDDRDQKTLLDTLKALGTLYHFANPQYPEHTQSTFVLDPEWVTRGVYGVLTCVKLKNDGGVLDTKKLDHYFEWDDRGDYPPEKQKFILDMMTMDQFELCFPLTDSPGIFLVPEQLSPDEIAHGIARKGALNFEYEYSYLPSGVIPRFIVRMHHCIDGKVGRTGVAGGAWRNGVVLQLEDCRALVRGSREQGRVFVSVIGPPDRRPLALAAIRLTLNGIHDAMKHLRVTALVPLPDEPDITESYDHLRELELDPKAGRDYQIRPTGAHRWYTVQELLDGVDKSESSQDGVEATDKPLEVVHSSASLRNEKPLLRRLIMPGVVASMMVILSILLRLNPTGWLTMIVGVALTGFSIAWLIRARFEYWIEHWAKSLATLCVAAAGAAALLPTVKAKFELSNGSFDLIVDNSSWIVVVLLFVALGFGGLEYFREWHAVKKKN